MLLQLLTCLKSLWILFVAAGCMTLYSYACNYWTWKAPTSCTLWSSTSGFHESEGVLSSAKDCPCHLEGIYFQGIIVATNISPSPPDCGRFLENTKVRPFELMVAYNSSLWMPGMETFLHMRHPCNAIVCC